MWLILLDRSATMGQPFADPTSRLSAALGLLGTLPTGPDLAGAKLLLFTAPELTWHVVDVLGGRADGYGSPEPAGVADIAAALDWAEDTAAHLDPQTPVTVVLVTDLGTAPADDRLLAAAQRLRQRQRATLHLILLAPDAGTHRVAEAITPARVRLAGSPADLALAWSDLLAMGTPPPPAARSEPPLPPPAPARPVPAPAYQPPPPPPPPPYSPPASASPPAPPPPASTGAVPADRSQAGPPSRGGTPAATGGRLSFTVAHPPEMATGTWYNLLFVLYRSGLREAVDALLRERGPHLGGDPAQASTSAGSPVREGTVLTLVPSIPGVSCNPPKLDMAWYEDVQDTTFRVRVDGDGGPVRVGAVEVYVGALLLAVVPVAIRTVAAARPAERAEVSHARTIDRVFASYSRRDTWVVDACAAAYEALGVEVLIDRVNLRSGEDWRDSLHSLISRSDLFQLYWSEASSRSSEVEHEWRFATSLTERGSRFIRPMYWEDPMPVPPDELSHLHFSRIDERVITGDRG